MLAGALSVLLLLAWHWWFPFSAVLSGIAVLLALLATVSVPLLYRLGGFTLADEIEWLEQREAVEHAQLLQRVDSLGRELADLGLDEGVRQTHTLVDILNDYHAVVETRFIGKKHSPLVYLSTARRVQKLAVQNLTDVVAVGHSLSSIGRQQRDDEAGRERLDALRLEQQGRLDQLLGENRQLFDALTDTAVEVANIESFSEFERLDTMARLVSLAEIANRT